MCIIYIYIFSRVYRSTIKLLSFFFFVVGKKILINLFLFTQVRTLFVSGLPMDAKPRELYLLFRAYEVTFRNLYNIYYAGYDRNRVVLWESTYNPEILLWRIPVERRII